MFKRTRWRCPLCFDTGFLRGFLSPIEVWMQVDPSPKADQTTQVGAQQQSNTRARVGYYPPLKPKDIIVEPENRRWRVVSVDLTEQGRAPVHQELVLHEIPPRDIEFEVPLELDGALRDLWLSPPRNYSNPHSTESLRAEEFEDLLKLQPWKPR